VRTFCLIRPAIIIISVSNKATHRLRRSCCCSRSVSRWSRHRQPSNGCVQQPISWSSSGRPTQLPNGGTTANDADIRRRARFAVRSLGWVPIDELDLTAERCGRSVNRSVTELTLGRRDFNDVVGRWGDVSKLTNGALLHGFVCVFASACQCFFLGRPLVRHRGRSPCTLRFRPTSHTPHATDRRSMWNAYRTVHSHKQL
jgi:hypothetical protein